MMKNFVFKNDTDEEMMIDIISFAIGKMVESSKTMIQLAKKLVAFQEELSPYELNIFYVLITFELEVETEYDGIHKDFKNTIVSFKQKKCFNRYEILFDPDYDSLDQIMVNRLDMKEIALIE